MDSFRTRAHRLAPVVAAFALASVISTIGASPVAAECDGPVPSFREHAANARRVVIGDVIEVDPGAPWTDDEGRSSRFTLRVRYVLRGHADTTMMLRDLAFLPCADHIIIARRGDRIALALQVSGFSPELKFDTVAWVDGTQPYFEGIERISVRDAFRLLDLDPPETSTVSISPGAQAPFGSIAAVLAGLASGIVVWRRSRSKQP